MSDFKINPALCFTPEDLTRFMKQNSVDNSTTQEIAAALIYRMAFEKQFGWKNYFIYFEPKQDKDEGLLKNIGSTLKMDDFIDFLAKNTEQATIHDVLFVRRNEGEEADVRPVQIKRFGKGLPSDNLDAIFIGYLENKIMKHYPKNKATLLVHLENKGRINAKPILEWLKTHDFNFEELVMFGLQPDGSAIICQLLPNNGMAGMMDASRKEIYML